MIIIGLAVLLIALLFIIAGEWPSIVRAIAGVGAVVLEYVYGVTRFDTLACSWSYAS